MAFGGHDMVFNIWTLPKSHPWVSNPVTTHDPGTWIYSGHWAEKAKSIAAMFEKMWRGSALVWTLAVSLFAAAANRSESGRRSTLFAPLCLLFGLGVALLPTTTLGAVKVGGSVVSYEIALYFIIAAVSIGAVEGLSLTPLREIRTDLRYYIAVAALVVFSLAAVPLWGIYFKRGREPWNSSTEKVYLYLQTHPGQVYFPTHPLCHLLANHELTHSEAGIFDRELGNFPLTPTAFESGCPTGFSFVSYHGVDSYESILKHFVLVPVKPPPELSDWKMFRIVSRVLPPPSIP